jgi:hypothetical protein
MAPKSVRSQGRRPETLRRTGRGGNGQVSAVAMPNTGVATSEQFRKGERVRVLSGVSSRTLRKLGVEEGDLPHQTFRIKWVNRPNNMAGVEGLEEVVSLPLHLLQLD